MNQAKRNGDRQHARKIETAEQIETERRTPNGRKRKRGNKGTGGKHRRKSKRGRGKSRPVGTVRSAPRKRRAARPSIIDRARNPVSTSSRQPSPGDGSPVTPAGYVSIIRNNGNVTTAPAPPVFSWSPRPESLRGNQLSPSFNYSNHFFPIIFIRLFLFSIISRSIRAYKPLMP